MKKAGLIFLLALGASPQDPEALVEQLRSDEIALRERAFVELEKLGAAAEAELKKAASDPDATVSLQVNRLLRILELNRTFSPALKKEFPDICQRIGRSTGDEWTKTYLAVADGKPDANGKQPYKSLTREDLEPLAAPAIKYATTSEEKSWALSAADRWHHLSAEPSVKALLHDPEKEVRRLALDTLVSFHGRSALPLAMAELRDSPTYLLEAIQRFGTRTAYEAQDRLIELLRHADPEIATSASRILKDLHVLNLAPEHLRMLKMKSAAAKLAALDYLERTRGKEAAEDVRPLLDDADSSVRASAAGYLWDCDVAIPPEVVRRIFEQSDSDDLRSLLNDVPKSRSKDPAVLDTVRKLLDYKNADVPPYALGALKRLADPNLEEICIGLLRRENSWLRQEALRAIGPSMSPAVKDALHRLALDPAAAADARSAALATLAGAKALPTQAELAKLLAEPNLEVILAAVRALAPTAPDLVREFVPRLLLDDDLRSYSNTWELADLISPKELGPFLLKALAESKRSSWYVRQAIVRNKMVSIIPGLKAMISEDDPVLASAAIGTLADLGAKEIRPDLLKLLDSSESEIRRAAMEALIAIGLGPDVDVVRQKTRDEDSDVRLSATLALRRSAAKESVAEFVERLDDESSDVAENSAKALLELGRREVIPKMVEWLPRRDRYQRPETAGSVLAILQPDAAEAAVLAMLDHRDSYERSRGATALEKFGLKKHVRRLLPLLSIDEANDEAVDAIVLLDARELIPDLERFLSDPESVWRSAALAALIGLGSAESVASIRKLLDDPDLEIRRTAAIWLGMSKDAESLPRLVSMLGHPVHDLRIAAAAALGNLGDPSAADALMSAAEKPELGIFETCLRALGKLRAVQTAPRLLEILRKKESGAFSAGEVLASLGVKEAIPDLIQFLDHDWLAEYAAKELAKMGAVEAIPAIRKRMDVKGRENDFLDFAGALADLGDSSTLVKALESENYSYPAAVELCARGDRRGVPEILSRDGSWHLGGTLPAELNAVRNPRAWKALEMKTRFDRLRGSRLRVLERIGDLAGKKIRWESGTTFDQKAWFHEWEYAGSPLYESTLLSLLREATDESRDYYSCHGGRFKPQFAFILEEDSIRILPVEDALKFWKEWWADEQARK